VAFQHFAGYLRVTRFVRTDQPELSDAVEKRNAQKPAINKTSVRVRAVMGD
jgi:hypothetical protein